MNARTIDILDDILNNNPDIVRVSRDTREIFLQPKTYILDEDKKLEWFSKQVSNCDPHVVPTLRDTTSYNGVNYNHYGAKLGSGWTLTMVSVAKNQIGK